MTDYKSILEEFGASLTDMATFMIQELQKELTDQGHILTGKLRDSIELTDINIRNNSQEAFVSLQSYFEILDQGVRPGRIPFNPGSGRKSSKYIDALIKFWMLKKGLGQEEATRAAFALAHKHKREGMPTQSSWQFSKNGRRMEFFTRTLDSNKNYDDFEESLLDSLERLSDVVLDNFKKSLK